MHMAETLINKNHNQNEFVISKPIINTSTLDFRGFEVFHLSLKKGKGILQLKLWCSYNSGSFVVTVELLFLQSGTFVTY